MNKPTKNKTISALDIAKYFIWRANKEGKRISNKKLQKLLYYSQSWNLVFNKIPLFEDEIEAWIHGPAIKIVYDRYKRFGFNPIIEEIKNTEIESIPNKELLNEIWKVYGKYDAEYLEQLTHNEIPWQNAREGLNTNVNSSKVISLKDMETYYSTLVDLTTK